MSVATRSEQHPPHHDDMSRRTFLKIGGLAMLDLIALEAAFIAGRPYLLSAWEWIQQQRNRLDVVWAREVVCNARTETIYSTEALQRTFTIASGDSIGEGYYKKGRPTIPASQYATEAINASAVLSERLHPPPNWGHYTVAREGSRMQDVTEQLNDQTVVKTLQEEDNIDWWISVGGNDLVHALANKAARIRKVADNPFTPDFFVIDDEILGAIARYQVGFLGLLRQIAARNKVGNIKRLVVEGLPDLGKADRIDYISRDGKIVESYPLSSERLGQFFATNLSILVNNAMKESINQLLTENPGMDILFLDTFNLLAAQEMLGEHPLPIGQRSMMVRFFDMAYHAGQNLAKILFPGLQNIGESQRRTTADTPWVIQIPTLA